MIAGPTVIVVRPRAQARAWVDALRDAGVPAQALPLIDIRPAPAPRAVADAAAAVARAAAAGERPALVFVSANAVEGFFAAARLPAWPEGAIAAATGPGTVAALRAAGVPQAASAAPPVAAPRFDSEALWAVVGGQAWTARPAWIVRGNGGREWFADRLRESGAHVAVVQSYERAEPVLEPDEARTLAAALAEPARWCWLFSSSEAIDRLEALAPGHDWGAAHALATHPRIAARARALGLVDVGETRPEVAAVVAALARG
ncbi:MAG: uroporphyrinogen-III synthase [Burkholderiaceae bacterium]